VNLESALPRLGGYIPSAGGILLWSDSTIRALKARYFVNPANSVFVRNQNCTVSAPKRGAVPVPSPFNSHLRGADGNVGSHATVTNHHRMLA